jgi:mannose-1-phosphate guanylyltransferase/mannose-6-phosphate isomerase
LFETTVRRLSGASGSLSFAPPIVLCNARHAELVEASLASVQASASAIVLEPAARNTAATAAIAAAVAAETDPQALALLAPADHLISDVGALHEAIARAAPFAKERIVTFAVKATRPAIEFGYVRRGAGLGDGVYALDSFHEKPGPDAARAYLADARYAWNSGLFLFRPQMLLEEFGLRSDIREPALAALARAARDGPRITLEAAPFALIPAEPFDTAIMQKTRRGAVAPCEMGWSDVGVWDEVWRVSSKDAAGNALRGPVAAIDAADSLLHAEGVTLCVAGVQNLIVVATPEAVIVLPRERAQDVKALRELAAKLT